MKKIVFVFLCLVMLLTSWVIPSAFAVASSQSAADYSEYDYSKAGSYFNATLTASDLIELLDGTVSDVERAYIDSHTSFELSYDRVTNTGVSIDKENGVTTVKAEKYTYTAANGKSVTWQPVYANVFATEGESLVQIAEGAFAAGSDTVTFDNQTVYTTEDITVKIRYEFSSPITIDAEDYNAFINLAYNEVDAMADIVDFYLANGDEILDYYEGIAPYEKYLREKFVYDQKKAEYDEYLDEVQDYEDTLEAYNAYIAAIEEYQTVKNNNEKNQTEYDEKLAQYNAFLEKRPTVEQQIKTLDDALLNKVTYLERQLYSCFRSDLINEVVSQKDKLTKIGAKKEDIDACAEASDVIRAILIPKTGKAYSEMKTLEEKYAFYVNNYEPLRDNVIKLTKSLYAIYSKDGVKAAMHIASDILGKADYTEKLSIFIAQLIYFSNALSDEPVVHNGVTLDGNVKLSYRVQSTGVDVNNVTILQILENNVFVTDTNNAKPISVSFVEEPAAPEILPLPEIPDEVSMPAPPAEVENPGKAPDVVPEPVPPTGMPDDFDWLAFMGDEAYQETIINLVNASKNGDVTERTEAIAALSFTPSVTVEKRSKNELVNIVFSDGKGGVLDTVEVDKGSAVVFRGELPTKTEDITATYVFSAWVTENGEKYDLYAVTENVTLYPEFTTVYKEYPIENGSLTVSLADGNISNIPLSHFIDVATDNWANLLIKSGGAEVKIGYGTLAELESLGASYIDVAVAKGSTYTCAVNAYDANGDAVNVKSAVQVYIPCEDAAFAKDSTLSYIGDDGAVTTVKKSYNSGTGMIEFRATPGVSYTLEVSYIIKVHKDYQDRITAPATANPGDTVTIEVVAPQPGTVVEYYYVFNNDSNGQKYPIENNSFVMPAGNITLCLTNVFVNYTVKFEVDGKVISEKIYKYGDTVAVPNAPIKLNDSEYSYKFTGWSPELSDTVTGNVIYVAQFEATPLPVVEKRISKFNILFYSALGFGIAFVVSIILLILSRKKIISIKGIFRAIGRFFKRIVVCVIRFFKWLFRTVGKLFGGKRNGSSEKSGNADTADGGRGD